ncbi:hypothetical protein XA68_17426 [Ophiocordyceps unilateralis]|uniref:Ras-GAP domain-containing protein n=1 Tax=Ophiocordyceps unilateralis TaxID=268505 RepID=A0A2A9P347_OPHUN|nr:hypothetical protein XA68_17426 [Ophiocordyceps unilateralis]
MVGVWQLPHRTGTTGRALDEDDILQTTQGALVDLSPAAFPAIATALIELLEDLARPFADIARHPAHVLQSEQYAIDLFAQCCSSTWDSFWDGCDQDTTSSQLPPPLHDHLVNRLFDALKQLLKPTPDNYSIPLQTLLDQASSFSIFSPDRASPKTRFHDRIAIKHSGACGAHEDAMTVVIRYITATSWSASFAYARNVILSSRITPSLDATSESIYPLRFFEQQALFITQAMAFFWVDGTKLGLIVEEVCVNYLHLWSPCQKAVAYALPLLVTSWVERYPSQFTNVHLLRANLSCGVDTLFEWTQTTLEKGKRNPSLYPLQLAFVLLLPDVFQVASNARDAGSKSIGKNASFLEGLKKDFRNGNQEAAYCLVTLLHVSRHFSIPGSGLIDFALEVQGEIKNAALNQFSNSALHHTPSAEHKTLLDAAIPFMQSQLEDNHANASPSHERANENRLALTCAILSFLLSFPYPLIDELSQISCERGFSRPFLFCVLSSEPLVRGLATEIVTKLCSEHPRGLQVLKADSEIILVICERIGKESQASEIQTLRDILEARLALIRAVPRLSYVPEDTSYVTEASATLETTLLTSLCVADIEVCQTVTSCIGLILETEIFIMNYAGHSKSSHTLFRNKLFYQELSSPSFRFTGLVAFQKMMHGLIQKMRCPTVGILAAWAEAFEKWIKLAVHISSANTIDEKLLSEWRNISGFLASLGAICTAARGAAVEDLPDGDYHWIDQTWSERFGEPLLTIFLRVSVQLLGCSSVKAREAMRDVLSSQVSPTLHSPLLKALETELESFWAGDLASPVNGSRNEVVFVEQAASLLRAMVESVFSLGGVTAIDLGLMTMNLTKIINSAPDEANTLRAKIRICNLCEIVVKREERKNMRDDIRTRNQLLEYIFGWMAQSHSSTQGENQSYANQRIRKDLDKACLKCFAYLTLQLPLQPTDDLPEAGMSTQKAQRFYRYFSRFLYAFRDRAHEAVRTEPLVTLHIRSEAASDSNLLITILSNLLSSNIDVGLKQCLNFGYHVDNEIRVGFIKVLHKILIQGIEFSSLSDSAICEKYEEMVNVLTTDISLPMSMSAICPTTEVDELTMCLLTIFEQRGLLFDLLRALIKQEIDQTENETEILRRSCVVTKMLSIYAKWKGNSYLRATLQEVLERLLTTSHDLDLELDPARVGTREELHKNISQLKTVAKVFMNDICASSSTMPPAFRKICSIITETVSSRFPNAKYTAVGAFVFLRFICPAIVAPESERLVSAAPTKEMRRGLLLIAKIIQNLANNVLFGAKEPYMLPLNPFLVQNVHLVTGFLREIAAPPDDLEGVANPKICDFGSCVVLHRFLYDHWDPICQSLTCWDSHVGARSPAEMARSTPSVSKPLQTLISKLGPPPLTISWNRPQIAASPPPIYTRFQNFMLRTALKSPESFMTSRAVYDGGESKDGLSIVCIILRHIEDERIDYDTLVYCYLKISSRLWHEPFGLFVDATCFTGRTEPPSDILTMLNLLAPAELTSTLCRIYIYNMNSAFKKCFRRLLRVSNKIESSVFHQKHADYHLISNLSELRAHFNLKHLQLPEETISVEKDTRYVFQPVIRLSKSKGMMNVVIKVGSQFVQITSVQRQEILPGLGLHSIVNDIFRLSDVEEVATTAYMEEESAFGVRIDGGKLVMRFTSPMRADVIQSIRGAKSRSGKGDKTHRSFERLVRPQDVPGTMLNLALTNLGSPNHILRRSSYDLLWALCRAFEFSAGARLICTKDLSIPLDPTRFVVSISKELACTEPHLTADLLNEFLVSWESLPEEQKPLSLEFIAPWLLGLRTDVLTADKDGDKGREKVAGLLRKLIDIVIDQSLSHALQHFIWPSVAQDESLLEIILDELVKTSLGLSSRDESFRQLSSVVVGIGTVSLQGKLITRLRKALNRSSLRPTRQLPDNAVWGEICVLLQFCLALSFDNGVQTQLFLPEVFHLVTMLSHTGGQDFRLFVKKFLVNTIHAAGSSFDLDNTELSKLRTSLDLLGDSRTDHVTPTVDRDRYSIISQDSGSALAALGTLVTFLLETCAIAAPSVDMANAWRARWMSLVASTAFQNNPALQPKAFAVMGYLACDEVDDDLLYQVLVALRSSISQFAEEEDSEMLVAVVASLSRMMAKLPSSRYGVQLFWLAIYLVQLVPSGLFNSIGYFMEAIMTNIGIMGNFRGEQLVSLLMQGRIQLEDAGLQLDDAYGLHFDEGTFHFAVCACLVRGFTESATRATAFRVISFFLEATLQTQKVSGKSSVLTMDGSPYLALILARCAGHEGSVETFGWANTYPDGIASLIDSRGLTDIASSEDRDLLLIAVIELVDFQCLEDAAQARSLRWMAKLAQSRPSVFIILCGVMPQVLESVILLSQDSVALMAAHTLLHIITYFALPRKDNDNLRCVKIIKKLIQLILV